MTERDDKRERTRQHLLATALAVFEAQGVAATRTLDVAKAAGVSHGTVFAHFPTREALVEAAIAAFGQAFAGRFAAEPGADLAGVLDAHLAAIAPVEDRYVRVLAEAPVLPAGARGVWVGTQAAVARRFGAAIDAGVAAGAVRDLAPALLFNTWLGLLHHHLANRDLFAPAGGLVAQRGAILRDHYLTLVRP